MNNNVQQGMSNSAQQQNNMQSSYNNQNAMQNGMSSAQIDSNIETYKKAQQSSSQNSMK